MALSHSRVLLLCRLSGQREMEAKRVLAGAQRQLASQRRTEEELRGFLGEYEARSASNSTPALLENRYRFLKRLRDAVDSQQLQSRTAVRLVEDARLKWIGERKERGVNDAMLEKVDAAQRVQDERRSQKEMDEFSAARRATHLERR